MSRIGKKPIPVPVGVKITASNEAVSADGPKGKMTQDLPPGITAEWREDSREVLVQRGGDGKRARAFHGLARSLIVNMVKGCAEGYSRGLEVHGVGYNVKLEGKQVVLQVGFANRVPVKIPDGIEVNIEQPTNPGRLTVSGCDKQLVGLAAAKIRAVSPPEPYQGKGVRYADETVRRKAGKSFTSVGV